MEFDLVKFRVVITDGVAVIYRQKYGVPADQLPVVLNASITRVIRDPNVISPGQILLQQGARYLYVGTEVFWFEATSEIIAFVDKLMLLKSNIIICLSRAYATDSCGRVYLFEECVILSKYTPGAGYKDPFEYYYNNFKIVGDEHTFDGITSWHILDGTYASTLTYTDPFVESMIVQNKICRELSESDLKDIQARFGAAKGFSMMRVEHL